MAVTFFRFGKSVFHIEIIRIFVVAGQGALAGQKTAG
jgi:hypothetical protein